MATEIAETTDSVLDGMIQEALNQNGSVAVGDVITHKDGQEQIVGSIIDADKTILYRTKTGEACAVLSYLVKDKLRISGENGQPVFTLTNPNIEHYRGGKILCLLHKDAENRAEYDRMGLRVCKKANISNPNELDLHMKKKHPRECDTITKIAEKAEKKEDRDFQRNMLQTLIDINKPKAEVVEEVEEERELYVKDADKAGG